MILLFYIGLIGQFQIYAQNNPYKINDECFNYLQRLRKVMRAHQAQAMCDTMIMMAETHKDVKAKCIAMNMRSINWLNLNDKKLVDAFPKMKEFIEKTPYHQYLYAIWGVVSQYYEKSNRMDKCVEILEGMRAYSMKNNEPQGLSQAYKRLGSIQYTLGNYVNAIYNMKQAYEIMIKSDDKNIYDIESRIGLAYVAIDDKVNAMIWIKKSIKHSPELLKLVPYGYYVNLITNMDNYPKEDYDKAIIEMKRLYNKYPPISTTVRDNFYNLMSNYFLKYKIFEKAIIYSDSIIQEEIRTKLKADIYYKASNGDSAAFYLHRQILNERDTWQTYNSKLLSEMTAANDKSKLELHTQQLVISQLQEKEKLLKTEKEKAQLELINRDLELTNRKNLLLAEQQKSALSVTENRANNLEIQRQKEKNRNLQREREIESRKQTYVISFLILLLCIAIFIYIFMKRSNSRLKIEKEITEKAKLKEEQQRHIAEEAMDKAKRADELKSLFLQNMSHEIRTPLNAIVGFNEIINGEDGADIDSSEREEFLNLIRTNSTLLTTLINDILDLSKLESGTYKLEFTQVDVDRVCRMAVASVEGRNKENVSLEYIPKRYPTKLNTDISRLQQVLINFLTNACKNTEDGKITLTCEPVCIEGKDFARFAVTDTGCGVPADKAESIFRRFEKLDDFKQGTGLGLSIVMLIGNLLHGNVYLDTDYKDGARFIFEHPLNLEIHS